MDPEPAPTSARPAATDAQKVIIALLGVLIALGGFLVWKTAQPAAPTNCTTTHINGGGVYQRDDTHCG